MNGVKFSKIIPTNDQIDVLYDLLVKRQHGISHEVDPPFESHVKFTHSNPYRAWYIVMADHKALGSFYISKENTVGINIDGINLKENVNQIISYVKNNYSPLPKIKSVRASVFSINVPPKNLPLIKVLEELNKEVVQISYTLI